MNKALNAILPPGTSQCRKGMKTMSTVFKTSERAATVLALNPEHDAEAQLLLRARCALCPARCKKPLA